MASSLGSLIISLEANVAKFIEGMTKAELEASRRADMIQKSLAGIQKSVLGLAAAAGIGLSLKGLWSTFNEVTTAESNLLKMANRMNSTVEVMSGLGYVGKKTGMDMDSFSLALERMQKNVSAAASKIDQAEGAVDDMGEPIVNTAKTFRELGLNVEMLNAMPIDQKLIAISMAMERNISPTDKSRIAVELFGRGAGAMVIALKAGGTVLQEWIDKQEKLGGKIGTEQAMAAAKAKADLGDLETQWHSFAITLTNTAVPAVTKVLDRVNELLLLLRQSPVQFTIEVSMIMGKIINPLSFLGDTSKEEFGAGKAAGSWFRGLFGGNPAPSPESAGPYGEAAETYGSVLQRGGPPAGLLGPGKREKQKTGKGGGGGKSAKEEAQTVVELFERLTWLVDDADKGLASCVEKLGKMTANQERLVSDQASYASDMAGLSTNFTDQLTWKSQALEKERELKLLVLDRELDEDKISQKIHDQAKGMLDVVTQAKKYALERERWAGQGIGGGLRMGAHDLEQTNQTWQATQVADWVKSAPKSISTEMASSFINGIKSGKMNLSQTFTDLGYKVAESMIQKMLEGSLNQVIPSIANSLAQTFGVSAMQMQTPMVTAATMAADALEMGGMMAGDELVASAMEAAIILQNSSMGGMGGMGGVGGGLVEFISMLFSAQGNIFNAGRALPYARGGVVHRPTLFPMAGGLGLMGEAGPEAVMPLTRTGSGDLGVRAVGGGAGPPQVNVIINNNSKAQVSGEQQANGDLIVTIDDMMTKALNRRGSFFKALGQSQVVTR